MLYKEIHRGVQYLEVTFDVFKRKLDLELTYFVFDARLFF